MKKLYGVTTAMVTPFTSDDQVDEQALAGMVEFLIKRGVHCLYPCGTTGEMFHLTVVERKRIAELVVKQAAGRAVVYIHAGAMQQSDTIELARHAEQIGADGIGVVTPAFFSASEEELYRYYGAVSKAVSEDFPIYMYNIPQCAANDLKPKTVKRITDCYENIIGIKYSLPDMLRTDEYLHIKPGFSVVQGTDRLFMAALAMGCTGTVSGVSNVYPEIFAAIYDAFCRGDLAAARIYQTAATAVCNALRCGSNMSYFKNGFIYRGLSGGHMRLPQMDLAKDEVESLYALLNKTESLIPEGILLKA